MSAQARNASARQDHPRWRPDKRRLARKLGELDQSTAKTMLAILREVFEE